MDALENFIAENFTAVGLEQLVRSNLVFKCAPYNYLFNFFQKNKTEQVAEIKMTFQMADAAYLVENVEKFGNYPFPECSKSILKINQQVKEATMRWFMES